MEPTPKPGLETLVASVGVERADDVAYLRESGLADMLSELVEALCELRPPGAATVLTTVLRQLRGNPSPTVDIASRPASTPSVTAPPPAVNSTTATPAPSTGAVPALLAHPNQPPKAHRLLMSISAAPAPGAFGNIHGSGTADRSFIVTGGHIGPIQVWRPSPPSQAPPPSDYNPALFAPMSAPSWIPAGPALGSPSVAWAGAVSALDSAGHVAFANGRRVGIWDTDTNALVASLDGEHGGVALCVGRDPYNGDFVWSGGDDGSVVLWQWSAQSAAQQLASPGGALDPSASVGTGAGGAAGAAASRTTRRRFRGAQREGVTCMALQRRSVLAGALDGSVWVLDRRAPKDARLVKAHTWSVNALVGGAGGETFFSGSSDTTIAAWDLRDTRRPLAEMRGHRHGVRALALFEAGGGGGGGADACPLLASGSADGVIRVWGVGSDDVPCVDIIAPAHKGSVSALVAVDGTVVSGGFDGAMNVWQPNPAFVLDEHFG